MLTLGRKIGESLIITTPEGHTIEVVYQSQHGRQIRLGINAHPAITVLRSELCKSPPSTSARPTDDTESRTRPLFQLPPRR